MRKFANYLQVKEYLDSFINYEKKHIFSYPKSLKLRRVKLLLNRLDISYDKLKVIHIAGTKGKGSVATFFGYLLASSGYRVGVYTSPHFFDFRERIKVLKKTSEGVRPFLISKKMVKEIIEEFYPQLQQLRCCEDTGKLTFFEVYTALAFEYFCRRNLDFVILEVGLGGRLDATNVVKPILTVITHIDYDHTNKLGKTLPNIAYEKAGIIKKNVEVVSSSQRSSVSKVIEKKAKKMRSRLFVLNRDFFFNNVRIKRYFTSFDFVFNEVRLKDLRISLKGLHQIENASLALAGIVVLKKKGFLSNEIAWEEGLKESYIEGRFEIVNRDPLIVVDIAHNPSSFKALNDTIKTYFPKRKVILVFGVSRGKDFKNMLKRIHFDRIIFTSFNHPRCLPTENLVSALDIKNYYSVGSPLEALQIAIKLYNNNDLIVVCGSLFLVAETKSILSKVLR